MRNRNSYQDQQKQYFSRSTINQLKPQIDQIFDINLREPPILKKQSKIQTKIFKMTDQDKKKIDYLISLGQQDNIYEIKNPLYNFIYNVKFPDYLIRKWSIRRISFNKDKLIVDVFQGQYMQNHKDINTKYEQFLYPAIIGTQKLEQDQLHLNSIINGFMVEGKAQKQLNYPLRDKHADLYLWSGLLFLLKFMYRFYQLESK
ncbi:unnamed protein product [Paramecium octaurelia]|uniref:Uncharacterized protein n=1 Tax=Paramecium octaurelia TaxID=43137 RepID=A0A8S1SZ52_PAROT|nr:unnamed protein product [Paramecium octaurelia]